MSDFLHQVGHMISGGDAKGYSESLRDVCRELPHALAEIIYKTVRYNACRNPDDLVKIAAWAAMEWNDANRKGSGKGDTAVTRSAWASVAGPSKRSTYPGARSTGSLARSQLDDAFAQAVRRVPVSVTPLKGRTGTGGRRRKPVGGKSGCSARKGKS